jgi:DNA-binding XRE family transcriptional regulator
MIFPVSRLTGGARVAEVLVVSAALLLELRTRARLTQQELADAAGLSLRAFSYLERGATSTPQRESVRRLASRQRRA